MSRQLIFTGTGTLKTWTEPSGLANQILNEMRNAGWGTSSVEITNAPSTNQNVLAALTNPVISALPTWNYNINVVMNVGDDEETANVQLTLTTWLNNWFSDIALKLQADSLHPMSAFLHNYGLWIAGGLAALLVVKSLTRATVTYAPPLARRYGRYLV